VLIFAARARLLLFEANLVSDCFGQPLHQLFNSCEVSLDFFKLSANLRHVTGELGLVLNQHYLILDKLRKRVL
jgi:hypothetical protein